MSTNKKQTNMVYAGAFGTAPCCDGCSTDVRMQCGMCGQCDQLDPFDAAYMVELSGEDPGEPSDDPFEYFGQGGAYSGT